MKKMILAAAFLSLLGILSGAQAKSGQKGSITFEAVKKGDSYKMALNLLQEKPVVCQVKAVKAVCEPSGTVIFFLSDGSLSQKDEDAFLKNQKPVGKMSMTENDESGKPKPGQSLVEPKARYETKYPVQTAKDTAVRIEILVLKIGTLQAHPVTKVPIKSSAKIGVKAPYHIK